MNRERINLTKNPFLVPMLNLKVVTFGTTTPETTSH